MPQTDLDLLLKDYQRARLANLPIDIEQLLQTLDNAIDSGYISKLRNEKSRLESVITDLKDEESRLEDRIDELEDDARDLRSEIDALESEIP